MGIGWAGVTMFHLLLVRPECWRAMPCLQLYLRPATPDWKKHVMPNMSCGSWHVNLLSVIFCYFLSLILLLIQVISSQHTNNSFTSGTDGDQTLLPRTFMLMLARATSSGMLFLIPSTARMAAPFLQHYLRLSILQVLNFYWLVTILSVVGCCRPLLSCVVA